MRWCVLRLAYASLHARSASYARFHNAYSRPLRATAVSDLPSSPLLNRSLFRARSTSLHSSHSTLSSYASGPAPRSASPEMYPPHSCALTLAIHLASTGPLRSLAASFPPSTSFNAGAS
eukprot:3190131-Rhodomonas_salina.1